MRSRDVSRVRRRRRRLDVHLKFAGFEIDADGHVFYSVSFAGDRVAVYPPLDPFSFEHAIEVEQTLLPRIAELYERFRDSEAFHPFHRFFAIYRRIRSAEIDAAFELDADGQRLLEIVKASIVEQTPEEEIERRAFLRWYQHVACESDAYRAKVREGFERLAALEARASRDEEGDR